jgi:molecular chaperone GrpE (heat shock protein)
MPSTPMGTRATDNLSQAAERDDLIQACIRALDMVQSGAVRDVLGGALERAGVVRVDPTGQLFDPDVHCSVGLLHTQDQALDDTVARLERAGYSDHGRQLRVPEVVVYTAGDWQ